MFRCESKGGGVLHPAFLSREHKGRDVVTICEMECAATEQRPLILQRVKSRCGPTRKCNTVGKDGLYCDAKETDALSQGVRVSGHSRVAAGCGCLDVRDFRVSVTLHVKAEPKISNGLVGRETRQDPAVVRDAAKIFSQFALSAEVVSRDLTFVNTKIHAGP